MPRDIPVGNGQMLVTFDNNYQIRDLYYPHVGQENHVSGPCRFGVWADIPQDHSTSNERRNQRLFWTDQGWDITRKYQDDTQMTVVNLKHPTLKIELRCNDVVDFNRPVFIRRVEVHNHANYDREINIFHHNDFSMYSTKVGDTAYFDPTLHGIVHYRKKRYLMTTWFDQGEQRIDEYATGTAGFKDAEGTWRDAEDGTLGNNPIAQGAVDSTMMIKVNVTANSKSVVYMIIAAGENKEEIEEQHRFIQRVTPQGAIDRTNSYWRLWLAANLGDMDTDGQYNPSEKVVDLYKRSLLLVRTQIDNQGAIIAANDTDIMQFARDTYSYMWPRDGAFVADAIDAAGFPDISRKFYQFCSDIIEDDGYFLHKYCPDGTPASSWHPWVNQGDPQLPIQEDETALVIWSLWRHYVRYRDIEFVRPLWVDVVTKAADFLVRFRDPITKLPLPSYDLWEERWGIHAFTVSTVYAGLQAAWEFAVCFGDDKRAKEYGQAAQEVREAFCKHFWSEKHDRFYRRITPTDQKRTSKFMADVIAGVTPQVNPDEKFKNIAPDWNEYNQETEHENETVEFEYDDILDSSMYAIFSMGMLDVHDQRVDKTMRAIEKELWVKTAVGGLARYTNDYYHSVTNDIKNVPGNPWFICTLWLAEWHIAKAKTPDELKKALPIFDWVADHALESGVLAEQVHPYSNAPLSVSPLTWSHATVVGTLMRYKARLQEMNACPTCGQATQCKVSHVHRENEGVKGTDKPEGPNLSISA